MVSREGSARRDHSHYTKNLVRALARDCRARARNLHSSVRDTALLRDRMRLVVPAARRARDQESPHCGGRAYAGASSRALAPGVRHAPIASHAVPRCAKLRTLGQIQEDPRQLSPPGLLTSPRTRKVRDLVSWLPRRTPLRILAPLGPLRTWNQPRVVMASIICLASVSVGTRVINRSAIRFASRRRTPSEK